jgi:hypothetical protein
VVMISRYIFSLLDKVLLIANTQQQDKIPTNKVVFRSCPIQCIATAQPYVVENTFSSSTRFEPTRCVWLPQYAEAKIMLEKYIQDIDHVHHIVHTPSLPTVLDEVYTCLSRQGQVKPGHIILLLAIFASCTHSWVPEDSKRGCLFETSTDANSQSLQWIKALEDVIDIAQRTTIISIEGIQGIIITFFVMVNFDGFSRRCRAFYNTAFLLARDLGLHCIDHPANAALANTAEAEMGRRVWWYLVASDWSVSLFSGFPHLAQQNSQISRGVCARFDGISRGVYQCHPRQMATKKPLNINDEDVVDGMRRIEQPLSQPTSMSYSLQRIRLAEISRGIVDRTPVMGYEGEGFIYGPSHEVVMDVDTELLSLLNDYIPPFFSMPVAEIVETYGLDPSQAARITQQGYMARSLVYAQRCKLHFPFYSRGFTDPTYALSRDICLQSARLIIQTESKPEYAGLKHALRYKFIGLLMSVFMAILVLLMDLCHNKSSSNREIHRGELVDALGILSDARHESTVAAKFLESLMLVLKKHKVCSVKKGEKLLTALRTGGLRPCPNNTTGTETVSELAPAPVPIALIAVDLLGSNEASGMNDLADDTFANGDDLSSYFSDLAQSFEQGVDVGSFDWNSILAGLDPSFD